MIYDNHVKVGVRHGNDAAITADDAGGGRVSEKQNGKKHSAKDVLKICFTLVQSNEVSQS